MKDWECRIAAACALSAVILAADAAGPLVPFDQAEMSMLVKGSIEIRPDGSVSGYSIEHARKLSSAVSRMIGAQVSQWRFEPVVVGGKPVDARTNMRLAIVARPKDDRDFDVRIQSAYFSGGREVEGDKLGIKTRTGLGPLVRAMMSTGANGDVYLALKIGPDGKVMDGLVEQVNLTTRGTEEQMVEARRVLGSESLALIRTWTFSVPSRGEEAGKPYWSGVLPVSFRFNQQPERYAQWAGYFPGPCARVPWRVDEKDPVEGGTCHSDAAPEGQLTLDDAGPTLLTPLNQG